MFPRPSCCLPQMGRSLCQVQALLRSSSAAKSERFCNTEPPNIHHRIVKWSAPKSSSSLPKEPRTSTSPNPCPFPLRSCVAGESDSSRNAWPVWTSGHGEADLAFFPPHLVLEVKALACELPQHIAAWDVQRAKLFGRCEPTTGIEPFHRVVDLVMSQEPYRSATRVFWVTDNGSSHRGTAAVNRLRGWYPNAILVHTPIHASWLNQIEIYFSILQRKALMPNECSDLTTLQAQIMDFQQRYESIAKPFEWKFTRRDLQRVLTKVSSYVHFEKAAA